MNTRTLVQAAFVAALAAAPALSFAQAQDTNGPVTRAEVKSQLIQLERAGYNPATADDASYPSDIQAAEARVSQQQGQGLAQAQTDATSGYGSGTSGSSQSGQPASLPPSQSIYFGN